jgi:hypothetical protein
VSVTESESRSSYDWVRLTFPRDRAADAYAVDAYGWFVPVPPWYFADRAVPLAPLDQVRDEPVIMLVSASGIGKSTALAQEHDALSASASCLVDLKTLAGRPDPVAYLAEQTEMPSQLTDGVWHVLLDSFDEALKRMPDMVEWLDQRLRRWNESERGRLRVRLATRPGERANAALEARLRVYWPTPGSIVVRDMAPLRRDDVLRASMARGIPGPEGFVATLEQRGLVAAISLPVPLTRLLDRMMRGAQLPQTGEDVYRLACEELCEETSQTRERPPGLGLQEIVRVAEHLAAVVEFCGNGALTSDLYSPPGGPVRLVDVAVADGPLTGGRAEEALSWLMTTPLLRNLSGDQWQFAHQGIQGFLAAAYLKDRRLAPANLQSLLFAGPGLNRYVHPMHRDVAGWLAWHRPEVFNEILDHDPAVLLSPDLPARPAARRAQVVDALFTAAEHGKQLPRQAALHRADHPKLAGQLSTWITPAAARQASTQWPPLELALAIARACPDHAPADALLSVTEDDQVEGPIRASALDAVPGAAIADAADRLRALTTSPAIQVSQTALLMLWPQHMPTSELLARAPSSAFESFWQRVEQGLSAADIDAVVAWLRQQLQDDPVPAPAGVLRLLTWMCSVLKPAAEEAPQPTATQLADILVLLLRNVHLANDMSLSEARETWASAPAWRRMVAGEVLARMTAADGAALAAATHGPLALLPSEDSIYWARKAAEHTTSDLAVLGSPVSLPYPGDTVELSELREDLRDNPRLAELTANWFAPPPAWLLESEESAAAHRSEIDSQLRRLLAERLEPAHVRAWWLQIVQWLNRKPRQYHENFLPVHLDLSAAPSCPAPDSPLRAELQSAATYAIEHAPVMAPDRISAILTFADACEVTALSPLQSPPGLTPERWAGLALILAFAECDHVDQEPRKGMLTYAVTQAGPTFPEVLPTALSALSPPQRIANFVTALVAEVDLGREVNQSLLAWANEPSVPIDAWRYAMQALAPYDRDSLPVLTQLAEVGDRAFPAIGGNDAQMRWAQAVDLLLLYGAAGVASSRWEQILASAEATRTWAQVAEDAGVGFSLYAHSPTAYWPPAYLALTPKQARQLYDRLAEQGMIDFPRKGAVIDISGPGRRGIHNRLPELIAQHLTDAAARELQDLVREHPGHPDLPAMAADHARRLSENLPPLTLEQFSTLTSDTRRRIVRDITELTQVVLEALDTLQEQALLSHGWSMLMWNRLDEKAKDGWWPTWEDTLSNLICAFLREHLAEQKPVINREVEIQPRNLAGGRTDVHVQATDPRDSATLPLTVIIEVKGCWNPEIATGISMQLLPYLQPRPGWAGIFLVGYFHHSGDLHESYISLQKAGQSRGRHRTAKDHTPQQILQELLDQIASAPDANIIQARVLQFPLIPPPVSDSLTSESQGTTDNLGGCPAFEKSRS